MLFIVKVLMMKIMIIMSDFFLHLETFTDSILPGYDWVINKWRIRMKRWIETFLITVSTWSIRIFIFLGFFAFLCPNNFTLNTRIFSTPEIFEPTWIYNCCFSILFRIEIYYDWPFRIWQTIITRDARTAWFEHRFWCMDHWS